MELFSMTCRSCGGKLSISKEADQCICQYCGTEYLVAFNEGAISIKLLSEGLKKIQVSTDKTASELALTRLKEEKKQLLLQYNEKIINPLLAFGVKIPEKICSNPSNLQLFLKDELADEKKRKVFINFDKIKILQKKIDRLSDILTKLKEISDEENSHLDLVRIK